MPGDGTAQLVLGVTSVLPGGRSWKEVLLRWLYFLTPFWSDKPSWEEGKTNVCASGDTDLLSTPHCTTVKDPFTLKFCDWPSVK